ncbi:MAG TPA: WD40 repeat domain-containing protein, partial [Pirellulales bacterium]|nr:WD40 repeat domain-containing protein [Pirellulales bacterium]
KVVTEKTEPARQAAEAGDAAAKAAAEVTAGLQIAVDARAAAQKAFEAADTAMKDADKALVAARDALNKDNQNASLVAARDTAEKALNDARGKFQATETARNQATQAQQQAEQKSQQAKNAAGEAAGKAKEAARALDDARAVLAGTVSFIETAKQVIERAKAVVPVAQQAVTVAEAELARRDAERKRLSESTEHPSPLACASFSADGRLLAVAGESGELRLHDASVEKTMPAGAVQLLPAPGAAPCAATLQMAFGAGGRLITADAQGRVRLYHVPDAWKLAATIGNSDEPALLADRVQTVDISPDGKLLATGGGLAARSGELKIWSVPEGKLVADLSAVHRDVVYAARFSPDGQTLVSGSADHLVRVFRLADGALQQTFTGHTSHVLGLSWKADGKRLASCGADRLVKIWDVAAGTALRTLRGDSHPIGDFKREVTSIGFIGDTEHLVSSSGDETVRMHRTSSNRDVRMLKAGAAFMHTACATSDGRFVLGGGADGVLRVWLGEYGHPVTT